MRIGVERKHSNAKNLPFIFTWIWEYVSNLYVTDVEMIINDSCSAWIVQEPLSALAAEYESGNCVLQEKIKVGKDLGDNDIKYFKFEAVVPNRQNILYFGWYGYFLYCFSFWVNNILLSDVHGGMEIASLGLSCLHTW